MKKIDFPRVLRHKSKYRDFDELKEHLTNAPDEKITMCMDKLLLRGARLSEMLFEIQEHNKRLGSNDFRDTERIKAHIAFRETHDDWIFERSGSHFDPFIRLIGRQGERK
jgi:hypothetical protein